MADVPITIVTGDYDRGRPIRDGRVRVDGCAVTVPDQAPEALFAEAALAVANT